MALIKLAASMIIFTIAFRSFLTPKELIAVYAIFFAGWISHPIGKIVTVAKEVDITNKPTIFLEEEDTEVDDGK